MFRIPPTFALAGFRTLGAISDVAEGLREVAPTPFLGSPASYSCRGLERVFETCETAYHRLMGLRESRPYIGAYFSRFPKLFEHPHGEPLLDILLLPAGPGADGFPKIEEAAFRSFLEIPHLFAEGHKILRWLSLLEESLDHRPSLAPETIHTMKSSAEALRTIVQTAAVTAPPDLWLMRQILGTHAQTGLLDLLGQRREVITREDAALLGLEEDQLSYDLQFLWTRGVLERFADGYALSPVLPYRLDSRLALSDDFRIDVTGEVLEWLEGHRDAGRESFLRRWLAIPDVTGKSAGWMPGLRDLEIGYRLLPVVLALKTAGALKDLRAGEAFLEDKVLPELSRLMTEAGLVEDGRVTALGARVFERGPGVYGIIGAYHPYLNRHRGLLESNGKKPWVERGRNIAASRDANRKSFKDAAEILWKHSQATGTRYDVVIEHAMGLAVGVQEFRKKNGDGGVRFFGADFEPAALEGAMREQKEGRLPADMKFLQADIGKPGPLIEFLRENRALGQGTVMIVGNGLHEARGKSDEDIVSVLRQYRDAGITLVFTEESGLTDRQIRDAGWNTYHAGFRWTHQVSGQGLRAPWPMDPPSPRLSWTEAAERAGYRVPKEYRRGTRTVFPCDLPEDKNPPISVTFLCIP